MINVDDKILDPLKVTGVVGKDVKTNKDIDKVKDILDKKLKEWKADRSLKLGINDEKIKNQLIQDNIITKEGLDKFPFDVKKIIKDSKKFVGFDQVGIIKNGKLRVFGKKYDEFSREIRLETAEDNSALYDDPCY